jgi:hypothetical protein
MRSLRGAINAKCRECIVDPRPGNGTWRQQVEACTAKSCPLYEARPVSTPCPTSSVDRSIQADKTANLAQEVEL